ncbi:MAG TPA: glycosyltransferase [Polyangia bacterium]|nr:glycosyltransferase [Polyangia bacterium]
MRIVDVASFFSAQSGGIKRYFREKARALPRHGFDCHFVVPGAEQGETGFGGGTLHTVAGARVPFSPEYHFFRPDGALGEVLRRLQPDVVEVGSHYFLPSMVMRALDGLGVARPPVVGFFHTDFPRQLVEPLANKYLPRALAHRAVDGAWRFARRQFSRYDATLVASRRIAGELEALGVPRVSWVGLGVDVESFRPAPTTIVSAGSSPVVTYLGRFSPEKELGLLMSTWDRVAQTTGARLRFIGNGPSRATIEVFAHERSSVSVEPYLDSPAAVAGVLAASDVVVLTSGTETFSLATAEALSCGTPVVGPARGAVGEFLAESGAGAAFAPGSAASLGDALVSVLARPARERRALGNLGREHILRHFTWEKVAARLANVYQSVAAGRSVARARAA